MLLTINEMAANLQSLFFLQYKAEHHDPLGHGSLISWLTKLFCPKVHQEEGKK
jgi:hypothetical protein